jgi:hypothetical protein
MPELAAMPKGETPAATTMLEVEAQRIQTFVIGGRDGTVDVKCVKLLGHSGWKRPAKKQPIAHLRGSSPRRPL